MQFLFILPLHLPSSTFVEPATTLVVPALAMIVRSPTFLDPVLTRLSVQLSPQ